MTLAAIQKRLAAAKQGAAKNGYTMQYRADDVPLFAHSSDWRQHASGTFRKPYAGNWQAISDMPRHTSLTARAYYCDNFPSGLREVGSAHDVCRAEHSRSVDHTGWFTDSFQSGTLQGYVLQLPARNGQPIYIPATKHSEWDGVTLYPNDMHDTALDCARAADQYAEHAAESEREYEAQENAKQQIANKQDEIATLRADRRALVREMRAARATGVASFPAICDALRERLSDLKEDSRRAYDRIGKLQDNYWNAVPD